MDLCGRSQRGALREASRKQASPHRWSRVNGWSWPLHTFQAVAWTTLFILAFANFGIFVPLLPPNWNLVIYGVTGGLFCFHFVVHLLAISIDPAETNVRLKNYSEPVPTFDPSKHTHVIENQYCHLCEVTVNKKAKHCRACNKCVSDFDHHCKWLNNCVGGRNYRCFFGSLVSASASLLFLITILLYVFVRYSVNPEEARTHPLYEDVSKDTWLLFLPLFPVKTKTLVVLGIGVFVLLLSALSLLLLGHLLIFHLFLMFKKLSTYEYVTQNRCQKTPEVPAGRKELSFKISMPQQADDDLSPSARREQHKEAPPQPRCPGLCPTIATCRESSPLQSEVQPSAAGRALRSTLLHQHVRGGLVGDGNSQQPDFVCPQVSKDQQEMRLPVKADSAGGKGPASGAKEPTLARWASTHPCPQRSGPGRRPWRNSGSRTCCPPAARMCRTWMSPCGGGRSRARSLPLSPPPGSQRTGRCAISSTSSSQDRQQRWLGARHRHPARKQRARSMLRERPGQPGYLCQHDLRPRCHGSPRVQGRRSPRLPRCLPGLRLAGAPAVFMVQCSPRLYAGTGGSRWPGFLQAERWVRVQSPGKKGACAHPDLRYFPNTSPSCSKIQDRLGVMFSLVLLRNVDNCYEPK